MANKNYNSIMMGGCTMKMLRKLTAFFLVFGLLAGTVAAMSAAVFGDGSFADGDSLSEYVDEPSDPGLAQTSATAYTPRLTAPAHTNKYYYSDLNVLYMYGWPMPNCVTYAWGRAYEILKKEPDLCIYSAYLWYDYNKDNKIYAYGQTPKLGAIACWVYTSGTAGHVAVVEKIENGTITFSNSAYSGTEFYTNTAPIDDPSDGRETWIFQGYIYIGEFENPSSGQSGGGSADKPSGDVYRIDTEGGVNLRLGAGTNYPVVGFIDDGETATVTEIKKAGGYTWGHTTVGGVSGWFALDYAKLIYRAPAAQEPTAAPTESPTQPKYLTGDVDGDGTISIFDATRIQLILAELYKPTQKMLTAGDYDGDGILTIFDAGRICRDIAFGRI